MAEKTKEELLLEQVEALEKEKSELEATIASAKTSGIVSAKVPGKATITLETPDGTKQKKTVAFRDGRARVRLRNGEMVSSSAFLKVVNGQKLNEQEALDPNLTSLTKETATEFLTYMVASESRVIYEVK